MFKKIVVGLDGSEHSDHALGLACDLAQHADAEVHIVHTPQPQTVAFAMGAVAGYHAATTTPSEAEVQQAADKILDQGKAVASEHGRAIAQAHIGNGSPADELVAYADNCGADLIVTGRRGLGSVGALIQGSTTQRVNHLAKCAVLSTI